MLRAFKEQLKQLSQTHEVDFSHEIAKRVGQDQAEGQVESVKSLIVVMPDLIRQIQIWSEDDRVPSQEKKLHGYVLTYLYHPVDFIPDSHSQLFSYVDDAYLVGSVFLRTIQHLGFELDNKELNILSKDVGRWLDVVRTVIPKETKKIDQLLQGLILGKTDRFDALLKA